MLLENYRNIFRRKCYKVLHAVTCCYKIVSVYISHDYDTSPPNFRFFVSLHGPSRPYKPLQQMYTLKYSQKSFFPRIKEKSSQNLRFRRNSLMGHYQIRNFNLWEICTDGQTSRSFHSHQNFRFSGSNHRGCISFSSCWSVAIVLGRQNQKRIEVESEKPWEIVSKENPRRSPSRRPSPRMRVANASYRAWARNKRNIIPVSRQPLLGAPSV